jgi:hypothetical protein
MARIAKTLAVASKKNLLANENLLEVLNRTGFG